MMWLLPLFFLLLRTGIVHAIYVTTGSPCSSACNSTTGTWYTDLVCSDNDFATTPKGQLLESCLTCESTSLYYVNDTSNDEYWFMFNMKFSQQACLIDNNNPHTTGAMQCATECNPLKPVLETLWINQHPFLPQYNYCNIYNDTYTTYGPNCSSCLRSKSGTVTIGNMVDTMVKACVNEPLSINQALVVPDRNIFNTTAISTSTATSSASSVSTGTSSSTATTSSNQASASAAASRQGLSGGAYTGIGIAIAVIVVAFVGALWFLIRRRKRSQLELAGDGLIAADHNPDQQFQDTKKIGPYKEMPADASHSESYGHSFVEADGRPMGKTFPVAELSAEPIR